MHLKEFQHDGKCFLSVVDKEDDKPQLGSCFRVYRYLRRQKTNQVPAIELSSFPPKFSIRVKKRCGGWFSPVLPTERVSQQVQPSHQISYASALHYIRVIQMGLEHASLWRFWLHSLVLGTDRACALLFWGVPAKMCLIAGGVCLALLLQPRHACVACLLWELVSYHQHFSHHIWRDVHLPVGLAQTWRASN